MKKNKELAGVVGMGGKYSSLMRETTVQEPKQNNLIHIVQREILQVCKKQHVQVVWVSSD